MSEVPGTGKEVAGHSVMAQVKETARCVTAYADSGQIPLAEIQSLVCDSTELAEQAYLGCGADQS